MTSRPNHGFERLKDSVKGNLVRPEDANSSGARKVRNAMIDLRPAVIVQCATADDVTPAIGFSREDSLPIAIRGARHIIAELSACDGRPERGFLKHEASTSRRSGCSSRNA